MHDLMTIKYFYIRNTSKLHSYLIICYKKSMKFSNNRYHDQLFSMI